MSMCVNTVCVCPRTKFMQSHQLFIKAICIIIFIVVNLRAWFMRIRNNLTGSMCDRVFPLLPSHYYISPPLPSHHRHFAVLINSNWFINKMNANVYANFNCIQQTLSTRSMARAKRCRSAKQYDRERCFRTNSSIYPFYLIYLLCLWDSIQ